MTDIMHVEGLCIAFGGLKAVDGVSFTAERNKITTVIGPNGAGKTTLFNLISGALKPSGGRVIIKGKDVTGKGPAALQEAGLARSFQITNLFFEMTVRETCALPPSVWSRSGRPCCLCADTVAQRKRSPH